MIRHQSLGHPHLAGGLQERVSADDIGLDECVRPMNRPIDMRLGSKMHHGVDLLATQQLFGPCGVGNAVVHKGQSRVVQDESKICPIACIRQSIENQDRIGRSGAANTAQNSNQ